MEKSFRLKPSDIKRILPDIGFALATDKITVDGNRVDYMIREHSDREEDSGWIFYGGGETQEYIDDPNNTSVYSLNTLANYDPDIIEFLMYPPGTEVERNEDGNLQVISENTESPDIVFMLPVEKGHVNITEFWEFSVNSYMLRRFDNGSLVIWRPGFTIWLTSYTPDNPNYNDRASDLVTRASPNKTDLERIESDGLIKVRYFLDEEVNGELQSSAYIYGFTECQEIHIAIYFDGPKHRSEIDNVWSSLACT
tara:strand:- start:1236 stop:1994 length:759 start_codon:yes stop_codon:yes gene_type:complete